MSEGEKSVTAFLEKIQGLILGSCLNNTYKMALIIAIAEQSLEFMPDKLNGPCLISYERLAREFLQLYWPQSLPFVADRASLINPKEEDLSQGNNKGLLKVITLIRQYKEQHDDGRMGFTRAESMPDFQRLVKLCVSDVVRKNPLEYMKEADFLYRLRDDVKAIELSAETIACLQRFHPLIISLAQNRWEQRIRELPANVELLGGSRVNSLRSYLFNPHRTDNLTVVRDLLFDTTHAKTCIYCGKALPKDVHVDHFIPYSRFTPMRIHNFVLACPHCNTSKSDILAGPSHVERWVQRNDCYEGELTHEAQLLDIPSDRHVIDIRAVALYENEMAGNGVFWEAASTSIEPTRLAKYTTMPIIAELKKKVGAYEQPTA